MNTAIDHKYDPLFEPFKIRDLEIPNRIVLCAMGGTAPIIDNKFNANSVKFFMNCAKNGVGLIIPGLSILTDKWGRPGWLDEAVDVFRGPLKDFMTQLHEETNTKFILQLGAGMGRGLRANFGVTLPYFNYERAMVAPSDGMPNVFAPEMKHRALTKDEIHKLVDVMINSAVLAKEAGCDGVEIHAIHEGYLLDQFSISNYNHRTDEYGGSLENRLRISTDMIKGIKKACGEDYPVLMRYSVASKTAGFNKSVLPGQDYVEWGRSLEESISVVRILEEAGIDGLDTDNGTYDSWHWAHPPTYMPDACNLPEAAYIKNFCHVPVFVSGKMGDPDIALKAVASGAVDAVAMARPMLTDPEWAVKVREGRIDDIRPCIGCHNGCFGRLTRGLNVSCALNPSSLQEDKYVIKPAESKKKVIVAGGGVGGMEAARLCALRGFEVDLYESSDHLGGAFRAAASPDFKKDDKKLLAWYAKQLKDLNIPVHMNTPVDEELVRREKADVVIVATGAVKKRIPIPGFDRETVCDAKEYLLENRKLGDDVVVVGGGLTGCEVANEIAEHGKKVSLVEMQDDILQVVDLCPVNSNMLRDMLAFNKVDVYCSAALQEIGDGYVRLRQNGEEKTIKADNVVMAAGYNPTPLSLDIPGVEVYETGDCVNIANLLAAVWGANDIVLNKL